MITFPVSDVAKASRPLPALERDAAVRGVLQQRRRIEPVDEQEGRFRMTAKRIVPNLYLAAWEEDVRAAEDRATGRRRDFKFRWTRWPMLDDIPAGITSAPVRLIDERDDSVVLLRFAAGLFGVEQDPFEGALVPQFGWAGLHDA